MRSYLGTIDDILGALVMDPREEGSPDQGGGFHQLKFLRAPLIRLGRDVESKLVFALVS